jgi:hypothetical protein
VPLSSHPSPCISMSKSLFLVRTPIIGLRPILMRTMSSELNYTGRDFSSKYGYGKKKTNMVMFTDPKG